eukprot:c54505_g1_i1.p1 GENE.c54505_g1_i1~~c54505_g1_i1.p1  ORF type:complete len:400 (+),score=23.70 c54505_g1_i1:171-1370(+)
MAAHIVNGYLALLSSSTTDVEPAAKSKIADVVFRGCDAIVVSKNGSIFFVLTETGIVECSWRSAAVLRLFSLSGLRCLALSPCGLVLLATRDDDTICAVSLDTGAVSLVAGSPNVAGDVNGDGGIARFRWPQGVVTSTRANCDVVYVADRDNNRLRVLERDESNYAWRVGTLAGTGAVACADGSLAVASFRSPLSLALTFDERRLFVGEHAAIRLVDLEAGFVRTVAGRHEPGCANGSGDIAQFLWVVAVAVSGPRTLLAVDCSNNMIRRLDLDSSAGSARAMVSTLVGAQDVWRDCEGPLSTGTLRLPRALVLLADGRLVVGTRFALFSISDVALGQVRYSFVQHHLYPASARAIARTLIILARVSLGNLERPCFALLALQGMPLSNLERIVAFAVAR